MLWSLWLSRNAKSFNNVSTSFNIIEKIIKARAWKWSKVANLIEDKWYNLWLISPIDAYVRHKKEGLVTLINRWFLSNDLVGFIDGALSHANTSSCHAGIGGVLMRSSSQTNFIFSGPSSKRIAFEVEEEALQFLLEAITNKNLRESNIIIASDSSELVEICNSRSQYSTGFAPRSLQLLANLPRAKVVHINRRFNSIADRLAADGKLRGDVLAGWT